MSRGRWARRSPDARDERDADRLAWLLDDLFRIPGTNRRFGLDALIGLIPGVGDVASTTLGLVLIARAAAGRLPLVVVLRMLVNTLVDALIGAIPFLGDAFDFVFKSNARNLELYRLYRDDPGRGTGEHRAFLVGLVFVVIGTIWLLVVAGAWVIGWLAASLGL